MLLNQTVSPKANCPPANTGTAICIGHKGEDVDGADDAEVSPGALYETHMTVTCAIRRSCPLR